MNLKRAIFSGALLWVLIFFEVSVLMFGLELEAGKNYYIIHYILLALLSLISAAVYFRGKKVRKGFGEGILVGIVFVIVGLVLDAVITVPLFIKNYSIFADPYLWVGIIEGLIIVAIVGAVKGRAK